jgi:hypothetical protein
VVSDAIEELNSYLIWNVSEGPIHVEDMPPEEQPNHPDMQFFLVVMMSHKDTPRDFFYDELWFDSLDGAYRFKNKVDTRMEPTTIGGLIDE